MLGLRLDGVRESHGGARLAHASATYLGGDGPAVTAYVDVRVTTLALGDPGAAGQFVRSVLRGALGTDSRTTEYREAARAFLASGSSRQEAAKLLQVAPNTVAYRVAGLSDLLGRSARDDAAETLMALELAARAPHLLVSPVAGAQ